jgi:hypothetical protein
MPRQGRALEQLVARLETILGSTNVLVQSPEYIVGRKTETRREVDVTLRTKIGSSELLVIIECRDRKAKQDTRWIEEVASKREDVGANKAVAVCPAGFTQGAVRLAEAEQIDLRTVVSVTGPEVFAWLGFLTVSRRHWNMDYGMIRFRSAKGRHLEVEPELEDARRNLPNPAHIPVLMRRADGMPMSVHDLWKSLEKDEVFRGLEPDKPHEITHAIDLSGDPPPYQIRAADGLVDLLGLEVSGVFNYTVQELPISHLIEYADGAGTLLRTAEIDVLDGRAQLVVGMEVASERSR